MMEGMYDSEVPPLYAVGIVDEDNQEVIAPFAIPGGHELSGPRATSRRSIRA